MICTWFDSLIGNDVVLVCFKTIPREYVFCIQLRVEACRMFASIDDKLFKQLTSEVMLYSHKYVTLWLCRTINGFIENNDSK